MVRTVLLRCVVVGCVLLSACSNREMKRPPPHGPTETTVRPGPDGVQAVDISVCDDYRFSPSLVNVQVGRIRLTLRHIGKGAPHNWQAPQLPGASVPLTTAGQSNSVRFTIGRPGDYRFLCSIHEAQGQVGRLVVAAK